MKNKWLMVTVVEVKCDDMTGRLVSRFGDAPIAPPSASRGEYFLECTPQLLAMIRNNPQGRFFVLTWQEDYENPRQPIPPGLPIAGHLIAESSPNGFVYNEDQESIGTYQDFSYAAEHFVFLHISKPRLGMET